MTNKGTFVHDSKGEERRYPLKWGLSYQGKLLKEVYGKKKAYDLLYHLSQNLSGLTVVPLKEPVLARRAVVLDKNDYYRQWRERNRDKVRAYQREYHRKRRELNRKTRDENNY